MQEALHFGQSILVRVAKPDTSANTSKSGNAMRAYAYFIMPHSAPAPQIGGAPPMDETERALVKLHFRPIVPFLAPLL